MAIMTVVGYDGSPKVAEPNANGLEVRVRMCKETQDDVARRRRRRHSSGDRETWTRKVEYFFASLGYAVGLGNIWRFPYLCYRNGGGAFLIPYLLALVVVGFPVMYMEMAFGQFASLGPITVWRVCPLFKGIGYSMVVVLILVDIYYNVLIAYALFYLFASITSELPWSHCDNQWNTDKCVIQRNLSKGMNLEVNGIDNMTHINVTYNVTVAPIVDRTLLKTPTEEFFENHLLRMSSGIHELGDLQWPLIVCLGVSWFTCFMCLFKGIKSMGKAVIFTTIFSYVILTVLLIRGVTLPGAIDGIIFYLKPDFKALGSLQVWGEASAQAFASLSLGIGGWITLSSYNKFSNKCNRDAILVGFGNALTSVYSGFVIFSILGYMAHIKGVDVADVTKRGPGLAFVAYPEAISLIPGAPFWSICFFFMMFTVGLDSLFGQVETIAAGVIDEYPEFLRPRRKLLTLFLCIIMFLLGIPLCTQGGIFIVTLMDWYTLLFSFSILSLFELIVIIYIYGYKRFANDIQMMIGSQPNIFFKVTWLGVSPVCLICVMIFLCTNYVPGMYGDYTFPKYAEDIGWLLAFGPCTLILIVAVIQFFRKVGTFERLKGVFTDRETRLDVFHCLINPTMDWGPALPENRRRYSSTASDRKPHPSGDTLGSDDVFGSDNVELTAVTPTDPSEKDRLVSFADEVEEQKERDAVETDKEARIAAKEAEAAKDKVEDKEEEIKVEVKEEKGEKEAEDEKEAKA